MYAPNAYMCVQKAHKQEEKHKIKQLNTVFRKQAHNVAITFTQYRYSTDKHASSQTFECIREKRAILTIKPDGVIF